MSRTAEIERKTKETEVRLQPRPGRRRGEDLDRRRLPRPHARAARPPRPARPRAGGEGRPRDRARTTPPRTSGSASARRSTRRSATAPASAATAPRWCRWTRRWPSARSTSPGRPFCAFDADLPDVTIAGFDSELTEEFFRAVANNAKMTLHIWVRSGSNAHHMIEAAFKAFARALREAVSIDPDETRRSLHQGHPDGVQPNDPDRDPRLRDGQPPLGREGAGAGRRRGRDHLRPRARRGGRRRDPARASAPSRGRWSGCARSASTSWSPGGWRPESRSSASASGCSCCSTRSVENEGSTGLGLLGGMVGPAGGERLQGPAHRLVAGALGARVRAHRGAGRGAALLLRPLVRARGPASDDDVLGTAAYGERFACAVERPPLYGVQFHPEKSSSAGLAAARELRRGICSA